MGRERRSQGREGSAGRAEGDGASEAKRAWTRERLRAEVEARLEKRKAAQAGRGKARAAGSAEKEAQRALLRSAAEARASAEAAEAARVHRPRQKRSARMLNRLLDAAQEILEERGLESATVPEIAARAGASVGAVYRRFADKDALLEAVCERFLARASEGTTIGAAEMTSGMTAQEVARFVVGPAVLYRSHPGMARAVHLYLAQHPDASFRERIERLNEQSIAVVLEMFRPVMSQVRHDQPELAIRTGLLVVTSAMRHLIVSNRPLPPWLGATQEQLQEELELLYIRYLGLE